jgi:hypothetical protein
MKAIRKGNKGAQVKAWQFFLIGQGYTGIQADGDFGKITEQATISFQKKRGLGGDGVVGNQTYLKAMQLGFEVVKDEEDSAKNGPNWPPPPDFSPLTGAKMQSLFGKIEFKVLADNSSIKITNNWQADNLVTVQIPQIKNLPPYRTSKITVHKLVAAQWQKLFNEWDKAGLTPLLLTYDGSYNPRLIRGSADQLSTHAYGIAVDLNVEWNKLGAIPALKGQKGSVRELVGIANKLGFYWGGHFSRKDGMHFEISKID